MWSSSGPVAQDSTSLFVDYTEDTVRKTPASRILDLPTLESTEFWQPSHTSTSPKSWLFASVKAKTSSTWTPPRVTSTEPSSITLWSKANKNSPSIFQVATEGHSRKAAVAKPLTLPVLESTKFWQPSSTNPTSHNWILSNNVPSSYTWSSRVVSPTMKVQGNNNMWSAHDVSSMPEHKDIFSHIHSKHITKNSSPRPAALQMLESTSLFEPELNANSTAPHWLHATCKLPEGRRPSMTSSYTTASRKLWTPSPAVPMAQYPGMWESSTLANAPSSNLFPNPHLAPRVVPKREMLAIKTIKTREMWRPSYAIPESPRNWQG
jgi:hypothetical protein